MGRPGTFQKGNKAAVGNPGPHREKFLTQALIAQLHELDPKTKKMKAHGLVAKLLQKAIGGDVFAIKEVFDRAEGKVPTTIGEGNTGAISVTISGGLPDDEPPPAPVKAKK